MMAADCCGNRPDAETNISTFVFLDFESTSLLDRKCRITELCLLAVTRVDLREPGSFPRVVNKLTLCLDPQMPISMTSSDITGLYNDSLEHQKPLTAETIALINAFLNHLSKPICLLAHNGNRFDFPLLVAELKRINQSLDGSLFCADTLEAFRSLDGLPPRYDSSANQSPGLKNQNTPVKNNVTSTSSVTSCPQSPVKRKGTNDLDAMCNKSPKVVRQNITQDDIHFPHGTFDKVNLVKAKKKLEFEDEKPDVNKDETKMTQHENDNNEVKEEPTEEFSGSLEDADYLLALENVETNLFEQTQVLSNTKKEKEHVCSNEKEAESGDEVRVRSSGDDFLKSKESVDPVANGSGYFVRSIETQSADSKTVTKSTAAIVKRIPEISDALPFHVDKTMLQTCTVSGSALKRKPKANKEIDEKFSSETNFTVTLRPKNSSPYITRNGSPKVETFSVDQLKTPQEVLKPVYSNALDKTGSSENHSCDQIESSILRDQNESNSSRKLETVSPVKCAALPFSTGCSPVSKSCEIGISNKSKATLSSVLEISRVSTAESSNANVTTSSVSEFVSSASVNGPNSSSSGIPLVSVEDVSSTSVSESASTSMVKIETSSAVVTSSCVTSQANVTAYPVSELPLPLGANWPVSSKSELTPAAMSVVANGSPGFQRQSYRLEEIYFRKFRCRPPQSHTAEGDCISLVKIAKCSQGFMEWVDRNAVLLTTIQAPF